MDNVVPLISATFWSASEKTNDPMATFSPERFTTVATTCEAPDWRAYALAWVRNPEV